MNDFVRRNERVETHIVLSYKAEYAEKYNSSQLLDISRSGMQFTTSRSYPVGLLMHINVLVPTSYPNKLQLQGTIAHSREKMKDVLYHTGIEFSNNSPEMNKEINTYLDYLGADKNISSGTSTDNERSSSTENRRYKRLKSQVIVQYIELGADGIKSSQIVDISTGGLLFNSETQIKQEQSIRLKMIVPTSFPHPIKVEGVARHSEPVMDGHLYQTGIEFSKEFPEPLEKIKEYIAFLEKKESNA